MLEIRQVTKKTSNELEKEHTDIVQNQGTLHKNQLINTYVINTEIPLKKLTRFMKKE
jgi:hypothetical protein